MPMNIASLMPIAETVWIVFWSFAVRAAEIAGTRLIASAMVSTAGMLMMLVTLLLSAT